MNRIVDWIRYSGASVSITLNPLHWQLLPVFRAQVFSEWAGPHEQGWYMGWLAVKIKIWINDGSY